MPGFSKSGHEHKCTGKYTTEHFKISIEMDTFKMSSSFVEFIWGESGWNDESILKMGTSAAYYVACENIRFSTLGTPWLQDHSLRHQYGISVAESQTFFRAKRPPRRRARRNGCVRRLLRLGHTRWHVAATHQGEKSLLVYRLGNKLHDTLQQQITLCVMGNCCENVCFCNRVLLPQQVAQIQPDLILCDFLW